MVLGLRTKSKRGTSIQVTYVVQVQDIKHWHSLFLQRSQHSILLNWENGSDNSGSISSTIEDGKMSFTESFKLSVTLWQEASKKDQKYNTFRKNCLELSLYELRMDMATKGHLLGTALINLAEYGIVNECITVYAPVNCKKNSRNTSQPVIFLKIYADSSDSCNPDADNLVPKVAALKGGEELASASLIGTTEVEFSSLTEDEVSLHSSHSVSSSAFEATEDSLICSEEENLINVIHEETVVDKFCGKVTSSNGGEIPDPLINTPMRNEASADFSQTEKSQGITKESGTNDLKFSASNESEKLEEYDTGQNKSATEKNISKENLVFEKSPSSQIEELKGRIEGSVTVTELNMIPPIEMGETRMYDLGNGVSEENMSEEKMSSNASTLNSDECKHEVNTEDEVSYSVINGNNISDETKFGPISGKEKHDTDNPLDGRNELISRIEMLEEELCEVAAIEAGFYSVVAEHGCSVNVVHASALRISRFYLNAFRLRSRTGRNRAAKSVISGLIVACKACGNDVPRLCFWFSNSIFLRATVSQNAKKMIKESSENRIDESLWPEETDNLHDIQSFISVLQEIESWLFSRIVDSIWWQTITPYMQSSVGNNIVTTFGVNSRKTGGGTTTSCILEQGSFSINHWKRAFTDICERLCPSRAGGHSCGCLQLSSRLVMELLVRRLDVAMFNAILRDSDDEMPTDPVYDPICDSKVLPVLVGKANFGAGVQLKNAVGTWSLWLTAIFGIDDGDSVDKNRIYVDGGRKHEVFKAFNLLNALSDLMMFPFKLLTEESTRKEVFPLFGVSLIKWIFSNFVPDEFCTDLISESMLNSLDSQDDEEESPVELIRSCPWIMPSTPYLPPTLGTLDHILGFQSPGYSGEDGDLNDLEYPLDSTCASTPAKSDQMLKECSHISRFRLLREAWRRG